MSESLRVETDASRRKGRPTWLLFSLAWLGPAILGAFQAFVEKLPDGSTNWRAVAWQPAYWLVYALLTPGVFWLGRRYRLEHGRLRWTLPIHFVGALVATGIWAAAGLFLYHAVFHTANDTGLLTWFLGSLPFGVAVYFAVLGVEHAAFYFMRAQEREMHAARLTTQLGQARMNALRMQMQPHFLLNSLNAIAVTVRDRDTETATRIVELLGDMLRRVIRPGGTPEVTLREELEFARQFLEVEQVRFSDRLQPAYDIDSRLLDAAVPEFLLQPLVENALRHGLALRSGATLLEIAVRREADVLVLSVTDDGPGPSRGPAEATGIGLANIRERLATMYGDQAELELSATDSGGARATVQLPYRELKRSQLS